jgi:hypothetical protein
MSAVEAAAAIAPTARAYWSSRASIFHPVSSRARSAWRLPPCQDWATTGVGDGRYFPARQQGLVPGPLTALARSAAMSARCRR